MTFVSKCISFNPWTLPSYNSQHRKTHCLSLLLLWYYQRASIVLRPVLLVKRQRLQTVRVTSRRIPIQLRQYLLLSKLASFSPNTSYLQHKCFNEPLPTTTKLRTTTNFLSGPVGCQDFDESSRSTGAPFNIHLQQTEHSLFFCYLPSHTSRLGKKRLCTWRCLDIFALVLLQSPRKKRR